MRSSDTKLAKTLMSKISDEMKKSANVAKRSFKIVEKSPKVKNELVEVIEKLGKTKNKSSKALESLIKVKDNTTNMKKIKNANLV